MPKKRLGKAANDHAPLPGRTVRNELPQDLPIPEYELSLIETHFAAMIAEMLNAVTNDNAPTAESGPGRRSEP